MEYSLKIANSIGVWIACLPVLAIIVGQAILIYGRAKKASHLVGLTPQEGATAFKTGLITAIGPSLSAFISIIAMSAIMGGPVTWMRCSIIASASTELRACQYVAEAAGVELGGAGFTMQIFCACLFVMAINGCGWLVFCLLFTDKMTTVTQKISGGSAAMMGTFATSAILGTITYMSSGYIKTAVTGGSAAGVVAMLVGAGCYLLLKRVAAKAEWLRQWNFGFSMLAGMIGGALFNGMIG